MQCIIFYYGTDTVRHYIFMLLYLNIYVHQHMHAVHLWFISSIWLSVYHEYVHEHLVIKAGNASAEALANTACKGVCLWHTNSTGTSTWP